MSRLNWKKVEWDRKRSRKNTPKDYQGGPSELSKALRLMQEDPTLNLKQALRAINKGK